MHADACQNITTLVAKQFQVGHCSSPELGADVKPAVYCCEVWRMPVLKIDQMYPELT